MLVILVRTVILYFLVVFVVRMMGKRQVGELQPSELVTAIMISDVASIPMQNTGVPLISGVIPILTLLVAELMISFLSLKSRKIRGVFSGKPSVIIKSGKLDEREMRRQRLNLEDLSEQLRIAGYPDISQIEYAMLETNGQISVMPKTDARALTVADLKLDLKQEQVSRIVVFDGEIDDVQLVAGGKNRAWLDKRLEENNIKDANEVFVAAIDANGKLFVQKKEKND